ncbi:hypothetical protein ACFSHQ_21900 [Gemmobacter lanyuensis]
MTDTAAFRNALPFWLSLALPPLVAVGVTQGGWTVLLPPLYAWALITVLDLLLGKNEDNPDPQTDEGDLVWYRAITLIWLPFRPPPSMVRSGGSPDPHAGLGRDLGADVRDRRRLGDGGHRLCP